MEMSDLLGIGIIAFIIIAFIILFVCIFGIASLFTFGTFAYMIAFIVCKKTGVLKISWWWILLGLIIPF